MSREILGTIAWDLSVSKSNQLNSDIFWWSSIQLRNTFWDSSELISDLSEILTCGWISLFYTYSRYAEMGCYHKVLDILNSMSDISFLLSRSCMATAMLLYYRLSQSSGYSGEGESEDQWSAIWLWPAHHSMQGPWITILTHFLHKFSLLYLKQVQSCTRFIGCKQIAEYMLHFFVVKNVNTIETPLVLAILPRLFN